MIDQEKLTKRRYLIATRLRQARSLAGLTRGQAASLSGLDRSVMNHIEFGSRSITAEELVHFSALYDVDLAWLAGERPERFDFLKNDLGISLSDLEQLKPEDQEKLSRALAAIRR